MFNILREMKDPKRNFITSRLSVVQGFEAYSTYFHLAKMPVNWQDFIPYCISNMVSFKGLMHNLVCVCIWEQICIWQQTVTLLLICFVIVNDCDVTHVGQSHWMWFDKFQVSVSTIMLLMQTMLKWCWIKLEKLLPTWQKRTWPVQSYAIQYSLLYQGWSI